MSATAMRFKSFTEQSEVIQQLSTFGEVRRQLIRHQSKQCVPVPDPQDTPDESRTTLKGRSVTNDDINNNEPFLMYSGHDGKLLGFFVPRPSFLSCTRASFGVWWNVWDGARLVLSTIHDIWILLWCRDAAAVGSVAKQDSGDLYRTAHDSSLVVGFSVRWHWLHSNDPDWLRDGCHEGNSRSVSWNPSQRLFCNSERLIVFTVTIEESLRW